ARADRGFVDLGIVHKHVYLYRIEFFPVGAKLPIKGWSIGAYAAPVTITRWVLKEGGHSDVDRDFGKPPTYQLATFATFADVGIALEQELKTSFDPKVKSSSSRPPQVVEFRSAHTLSREAFFGATSYTITGAVLSASVTSTASLGGGPKSMVMVLTVNRGGVPVELVGGVDQWLTKPSLASQQFKPHNLSVSLTLFSLCLGWGCIGNPFQPAPVVRREGTLKSEDRTAPVHGEVQGSFRVNSASLEGRSLAAVEEVLAIDRAMFVQDGGVATAA